MIARLLRRLARQEIERATREDRAHVVRLLRDALIPPLGLDRDARTAWVRALAAVIVEVQASRPEHNTARDGRTP